MSPHHGRCPLDGPCPGPCPLPSNGPLYVLPRATARAMACQRCRPLLRRPSGPTGSLHAAFLPSLGQGPMPKDWTANRYTKAALLAKGWGTR